MPILIKIFEISVMIELVNHKGTAVRFLVPAQSISPHTGNTVVSRKYELDVIGQKQRIVKRVAVARSRTQDTSVGFNSRRLPAFSLLFSPNNI